MSYIPQKREIRQPLHKRAVIDNFSGGVCIDETHSALSDRQSPDMLNMWHENNILCTRDGQRQIFRRAAKRTYIKNISPLFSVTAAKAPLVSPTAAGVILNTADGYIEATQPATSPEGFYFSVDGGRKRKYLVTGEVMNVTNFSVILNYRGGTVFAKPFTIARSATTYTKFSATITTDDTADILKVAYTDNSMTAKNKSTWRNLYIFDCTYAPESELNAYMANFLTEFPKTDYSSYQKYESNFSHTFYDSADRGMTGYFYADGSFGIFSSSLLAGGINCFPPEMLYGMYFFHAGGNIYMWSGKPGEIPLLCAAGLLQNEKSLGFMFLSRAYFKESRNYVCVKKEDIGGEYAFTAEAVTPYVPAVLINAESDGWHCKGDPNESYNLIGKQYAVTYNTKVGDTDFYLLNFRHYQNPITVELNGKKLSSGEFSVHINFSQYTYVKIAVAITELTAGFNNLKITCTMNDDEFEAQKKHFFLCTIAKSFGGSSSRGTRIFLAGNPQEPAKYYRSYIQNCTYFPDSEYDYIGAGTERITAFELQYGDMIIFTESSIYQMTYSFDGTSPTFATRLINSAVGCDMPGSVCLVDNRLVFANTEGGVYIIDHFNDTDEKNIKQISLNVNGSKYLKKGLLSEQTEALRGAVCAVFGGRYYLHAGARTYVWDYGLRGFDYSSEYYNSESEGAQRKLVWYIFDNIHAVYFFRCQNEVSLGYITDYQLAGSGTNLVIFDSRTNDFGTLIRSYYQTKLLDFGIFMYKKLAEFAGVATYTKYETGGTGGTFTYGKIKLTCIADSLYEKSYVTYLRSYAGGSDKRFYNYCRFRLALPKAFLYALKFESVDGPINIAKVTLDYYVDG